MLFINFIRMNEMAAFDTLINCNQLAEILEQPDLVILDASIPPVGGGKEPENKWPFCVIPQAKKFDLNNHFSDLTNALPHSMPSAAHFEKSAQALGINKESQIVVYDNLGLFSAARAWWMFKAMGHKNIAVLDGGLPSWVAGSNPIMEANEDALIPVGNFKASYVSKLFTNTNYILDNLDNDNVIVVDARAQARFFGQIKEPRAGIRAGHIPQSKNLPYTSLLTNGHFKPINELVLVWENIATKDKQLIFSCGSGVTACILALSAELVGYENLSVFDGSWSEWGADASLPIE